MVSRSNPFGTELARVLQAEETLLANIPLLDQLPDSIEFLVAGLFHLKRPQRQLTRAPCEETFAQFTKKAAFSILLRHGCSIDVGSFFLVAFNKAFFRHDLQQLQDPRIHDRSFCIYGLKDFSNSCGTATPEDS